MKLKDFPKYELSGINRFVNISRYVPQPMCKWIDVVIDQPDKEPLILEAEYLRNQ